RGGADAARPAAVRLLDEHERRVVVLKLDPASGEATAESVASGSPRAARRARRPGRAMRRLAVALIALGTLALADAVLTLVWEEPISALYARLRQDHLSGQLGKEER